MTGFQNIDQTERHQWGYRPRLHPNRLCVIPDQQNDMPTNELQAWLRRRWQMSPNASQEDGE